MKEKGRESSKQRKKAETNPTNVFQCCHKIFGSLLSSQISLLNIPGTFILFVVFLEKT